MIILNVNVHLNLSGSGLQIYIIITIGFKRNLPKGIFTGIYQAFYNRHKLYNNNNSFLFI